MSDADFDSKTEFDSVQTQQMLADIATTMRTANQHQEVMAKQLAAINSRLEALEAVPVYLGTTDSIRLGCWVSAGFLLASLFVGVALVAVGGLGVIPFLR